MILSESLSLIQLVLGGIVNEDIGTSLLNDLLLAIMKADKSGHPYLAVVVSFARHCVEDFAGIVPRKQRLLLTKHGIEPPKSEVHDTVMFLHASPVLTLSCVASCYCCG